MSHLDQLTKMEEQLEFQSIFENLFEREDFEIVLQRVFLLLDAASLESCSLVCKKWRKFILSLFQRHVSSLLNRLPLKSKGKNFVFFHTGFTLCI